MCEDKAEWERGGERDLVKAWVAAERRGLVIRADDIKELWLSAKRGDRKSRAVDGKGTGRG